MYSMILFEILASFFIWGYLLAQWHCWFFADVSGKKRQGKKRKLRTKEGKLLKGRWKIEKGRWKSYQMRKGLLFLFFFFFAFHFRKRWKFVLDTKMGIFYQEKTFHARKKNQEKLLCPLRKICLLCPCIGIAISCVV